VKRFYLAPLNAYQYISRLFPASCRYYPTCSEYAKWQFELNRADKALLQTTLRILRCNQLFDGGIDYPLVAFSPYKPRSLLTFNTFCGKIDVIYWLVPKSTDSNNSSYYVLKDFDAINRTT
jgi:putative membrane protein insertion efficiency factor